MNNLGFPAQISDGHDYLPEHPLKKHFWLTFTIEYYFATLPQHFYSLAYKNSIPLKNNINPTLLSKSHDN